MKKFFVFLALAIWFYVPNLTVFADESTPTPLPTDTPEYASNTWLDTPVRDAYERCNVGFGEVNVAGGQDFHNGIDLACSWPEGTPVLAVSNGTVVFTDWFPSYYSNQPNAGHGNTIVIQHPNGVYSYYAHLSDFAVYPGQYVDTGQIIGYLGQTGAATGVHLHFAIAVYPPDYIENNDCWNETCWIDPDRLLSTSSPQKVIFEPTSTPIPIMIYPTVTPTTDQAKMFPTPTFLPPYVEGQVNVFETPTSIPVPTASPTSESNWLKEIVRTFIDLPTPTTPSLSQESVANPEPTQPPTPIPLPTDTPVITESNGCSLPNSYRESVLKWCPLIEKWGYARGIDPQLIAALITQESGGDATIMSNWGAVGLMQIMPSDGIAGTITNDAGVPYFSHRPTIAQLQNPDFNLEYGTQMLLDKGILTDPREALRLYGPASDTLEYPYYYADKVLGIYYSN